MGTGGLDNQVKVAQHEYDFKKDGGAIGDITLRGTAVPKGALILDGMIDVETALTSAGAATGALKQVGAGDILAAAGKATFAANAILDIVPIGTAATAIRSTAKGKPVLTVAVADLTAGKFTVIQRYVMPRD